MRTNTLLFKNAKEKENVRRNTSTDAFIHAFIIIWEIVNTDSVAISLTPSKDKLTDQSQQKRPAKNFIMKTTAQTEANANIPMI